MGKLVEIRPGDRWCNRIIGSISTVRHVDRFGPDAWVSFVERGGVRADSIDQFYELVERGDGLATYYEQVER